MKDTAIDKKITVAVLLLLLCLHHAVYAANTSIIKRFMNAAKNGNKQVILELLDKVAIDIRDNKARTAVHYAILHQQDMIVSTLIAKGADYNIIDADGNTPLDLLREYHSDATQDLLPADAVTAIEVEKITETAEKSALLFKAVEDGNRKRVEQLLSEGANPKIKNQDGLFPFHIAVQRKQPILAAILLLAMHDNVNGTDDKSWSALHWAILGRDWGMVRDLLHAGAVFKYRMPNNYRPYQDPYEIAKRINKEELFLALVAEAKSMPIIETLAEKATRLGDLELCAQLVKYFPTYMLKNTMSAHKGLKAAINSGHTQIVELLLSSGINKEAYLKRGFMMNYRVRGTPEIANLLIKHGLHPDEPNAPGRIAIVTLYSSYDKDEALQSASNLLEQGANPNISDSSGDTPILALIREAVRPYQQKRYRDFFSAALQDLLHHKADLNSVDAEGRTALMLLAGAHNLNNLDKLTLDEQNRRISTHNSEDIARLAETLLANGADPNKKDIFGNTALDYARKHNLSTIKALIADHQPLDASSQ